MIQIQFLPKRHSKSSEESNMKKVANATLITIMVTTIYRVVSYMPRITYIFRNAYNNPQNTDIPVL